MQRTRITCLLILAAMALLYACKHELPGTGLPATGGGTGGSGGTGGGTGPGSSLVCFESEVLPIFQTNCAKSGCHDAASHQNGIILDSYANIVREGIVPYRASNSKVYKVLFETGNDKMPLAPNPDLSSTQKALIGRWINEGAQNTRNCGTGCDSTQFRYSAHIQPIISNYCIGCHSGAQPSGGINYSTYDGVRAQAITGRLYNAVSHAPGYSPMPQNAAKLSECQLTQIRKWVAAGAPNN